MVRAARRISDGLLWPLLIALLAPAIIVVSAAILLGLLAWFVLWLATVAALVSAIVVADLVRGSMRCLALAPVRLERRTVGVPGR